MKSVLIVILVALSCGALAAPATIKEVIPANTRAVKEDLAIEESKNEDGNLRKKKSPSYPVCVEIHPSNPNQKSFTVCQPANGNAYGGGFQFNGNQLNSQYATPGQYGSGSGYNGAQYGAGSNGYSSSSSGYGAGAGIGTHISPYSGRPLFTHTQSATGAYSPSSHGGYRTVPVDNPASNPAPTKQQTGQQTQESVGAPRSKIFDIPYYQSPYPIPSYSAPIYNPSAPPAYHGLPGYPQGAGYHPGAPGFYPPYNPLSSYSPSPCANNLMFSCQPNVKSVPCSQYPQYPTYPEHPGYSGYPSPSLYPASGYEPSYRDANVETTHPGLQPTPQAPHPQRMEMNQQQHGPRVGAPQPLGEQMQQQQQQQPLNPFASPSTPNIQPARDGPRMADGNMAPPEGASRKDMEEKMQKEAMSRMAEIAQKMRSEKAGVGKIENPPSNAPPQGINSQQFANGRSAYQQTYEQNIL